MDRGTARRPRRRPHHAEELEHDPEKWVPVFGHDHAQTKSRFFAQIFRPFFAPPARAGGSQLSLNHSGFAAHCHPDSHREQGRVKRCVSSPEMSMKTRAAKFVVAIAASILSSANLLAAPENAEQAGDKCLASPGEKTPAGGHWRYRLERGTGRQCWYLKGDSEKSARKAPEETAAAVEEPAPAPARKKPPATHALTDARAEFSRTPVEPDSKPGQAQGSPFPTLPTTPVATNLSRPPQKKRMWLHRWRQRAGRIQLRRPIPALACPLLRASKPKKSGRRRLQLRLRHPKSCRAPSRPLPYRKGRCRCRC